MGKDIDMRNRGAAGPHDKADSNIGTPCGPKTDVTVLREPNSPRSEYGEAEDRLPKDPILESPIWQRYHEPLSRLVEQSRDVKELDFARRQVNEAVALAVAAITDAATADVARSKCLAHLSHELRTPLSAIIGFAEVIGQGMIAPSKSKDKSLEYANDIKDAGHHLLDLVNDILDIAKVEAGKHELNEGLLDFSELIQSSIAMVRERATASRISLKAEIPETCAGLTVDGRKLKQVLVNLLSNAVKFTPAEGQVVLAVEPVDKAGVEISVTDTGIGMSAEELEFVLEPFAQFRRDLVTGQSGSGLGLPLAKALIELHGGTMDIESEPGAGTTVRVTLPRARAERSEDPPLADPASPSQPKVA